MSDKPVPGVICPLTMVAQRVRDCRTGCRFYMKTTPGGEGDCHLLCMVMAITNFFEEPMIKKMEI